MIIKVYVRNWITTNCHDVLCSRFNPCEISSKFPTFLSSMESNCLHLLNKKTVSQQSFHLLHQQDNRNTAQYTVSSLILNSSLATLFF
jgi:hypothetical protein